MFDLFKHPILIDTREQTPWVFDSHPTLPTKLDAGDYSLKGLESYITIERKSLPDMIGCCGSSRDRFIRELLRLRGYRYSAVIIEGTRQQIQNGKWRSSLKPAQVIGSINSWRVKYNIEFIYAGNAKLAAQECYQLLHKFYKQCVMFAGELEL
jgi:DNA excision repair protein ERCC-4